MAQRKPKRPVTDRALSSRQWAWEFLRFNADYRKAYAAWLELPEAVRNASVSSTGTPLGDCPPDTSMSFFKVTPIAQIDETVSEWLARTEDERKSGWSAQPSSNLTPPKDFLISDWVDPKVSPLPKEKEHIWDNFSVDAVVGLVTDKHLPKRAAVSVPPLTDIHELAFIVDVRSPLVALEKKFKEAVLSHRAALYARSVGESPVPYEGKSVINSGGIYEKLIVILQRLDRGEAEDDVRRKEKSGGQNLPHGSPYIDNMKTQIPDAIALRDGGYKLIAYRDDFVGNLKKRPVTGKT
jgi:hypothetical protein